MYYQSISICTNWFELEWFLDLLVSKDRHLLLCLFNIIIESKLLSNKYIKQVFLTYSRACCLRWAISFSRHCPHKIDKRWAINQSWSYLLNITLTPHWRFIFSHIEVTNYFVLRLWKWNITEKLLDMQQCLFWRFLATYLLGKLFFIGKSNYSSAILYFSNKKMTD